MTTDIDIDVQNRKEILKHFKHYAARATDGKKHNVGVYFQEIPYNPLTDTANIDYKTAEELGYFKIDILNNSIYDKIKDETHLIQMMKEPDWSLFQNKEIVEQLAHINGHFDIVSRMKPKSVEELAMVLAMIRPAKQHLIGKSWDTIKQNIWIKPDNAEYFFKKAHATSYSLSIIVQLNLLIKNEPQ